MKDPHVHVEKDLLMSHALIRSVISEATGLAVGAPKTVATGCGRRRPYAMTSTVPEQVTCLACREWACHQYEQHADAADAMLSSTDITVSPELRQQCAQQAVQHRELAARHRGATP